MRVKVWVILVASGAVYALGIVWYSLLAEIWAVGWGLNVNQIQEIGNGNITDYLISLLVFLIYGWAFGYLAFKLNIESLPDHIKLGMFLAGLLIVPTIISNNHLGNVGAGAIMVDTLYIVIRALIFSIIIGLWRKRRA